MQKLKLKLKLKLIPKLKYHAGSVLKMSNNIGLQTHMNRHWIEKIAITGDYDEPVDFTLDDFKPFKSYKFRVTLIVYK